MKKVLLSFAAVLLAGAATAQVTVDFEDFNLKADTVDVGKTLTPGKGFDIQGFNFCNGYVDYDGYDYYDGFAISTMTSTAFQSLSDQYNSCVGSGADQSKTYAILYYSTYGGNTMQITHSENHLFSPQSVAVTNAAYAFSIITNGNSFAKRFTADDWFRLYIIGKKGGEVTDTVTVDLAADGMLLFAWRTIDLTSLGEVDQIVFSMNSTDVGAYGMNTPAYCCFDNFVSLVSETTAAKSINSSVNEAAPLGLYSVDGTQQQSLRRGLNLLRMNDGSIRKIYR